MDDCLRTGKLTNTKVTAAFRLSVVGKSSTGIVENLTHLENSSHLHVLIMLLTLTLTLTLRGRP